MIGPSIPTGLSALWSHRRPVARLALVGIAAATIATAAFLAYLPTGRTVVLQAEAQAIHAQALSLAPVLADSSDPAALSASAYATVDSAMSELLDDEKRIGGKLWSLEGLLLYSHTGANVGRQFAAVQPWIEEALAKGGATSNTDIDHTGELLASDELLDIYVPVVHPVSGVPIAILEVHEDRRALATAYSNVATVGWQSIWLSFSLLAVSLAVFIGSTVRGAGRDRADGEARALERLNLVETADKLASELEVDHLFGALNERVRPALGLTRFALIEPGADTGTGFAVRLSDGSHVVAERTQPPFTPEEQSVIRSCARSLDAALTNAALYEQVRSASIARSTLLGQVATAHEDERRRLVGELHDGMASQLLRALYAVRRIDGQDRSGAAEARDDLADLEEIIVGSEELLRAFMGRVRPAAIDELGLTGVIEDAVARFGRESGLAVRLRVRGDPDRLDAPASLAMYRAAEEAMLNIRKHANASAVRVTLIGGSRGVTLVVEDDGQGLVANHKPKPGSGLGLAYVRERAAGFGGQVRLGRSRLGGARLIVDLPLVALSVVAA